MPPGYLAAAGQVTHIHSRDLRPGAGYNAAGSGRRAFPGQWHARMEGRIDVKEARQQL